MFSNSKDPTLLDFPSNQNLDFSYYASSAPTGAAFSLFVIYLHFPILLTVQTMISPLRLMKNTDTFD